MKFILLISSILFAFFLHGQEFKLVEATSQKWAGGQANSGHGINYRLTIVFNKKVKKLHIDSLWIGDEVFAVKMIKNINNINVNYYSRNDTIYLSARKRIKTNEYGDDVKEDIRTTRPPVSYQGAALLCYHIKKRIKYFEIKDFRLLEPLYYP